MHAVQYYCNERMINDLLLLFRFIPSYFLMTGTVRIQYHTHVNM